MAGNKTIEFAMTAPDADAVAVAGTFNDWDPGKTPMTKGMDGTWRVKASLPPGRYEYRFVVDGQWLSDPNAKESVPNPHGGDNSAIIV
jgi:1,4-alpha-glucan branching enzyme